MKNELIHTALDWRYATKKYDAAREIPAEDWTTLETALVKAPSSYGLQPFKFLVVETAGLRAQLREVSWGQSQVTDASKLVVILAKEKVDETDIQKYIDRIASVRGLNKKALQGFQDMMVDKIAKGLNGSEAVAWAQRQAYIALGFLIETAALLRIDATPMEGFDSKAYDQILGLEGTGWHTTVVAAVGYRHAEDVSQNFKKVRRENSEVLQYR